MITTPDRDNPDSAGSAAAPIDWLHLAAQTMDDADLARELLILFDIRSDEIIQAFAGAASGAGRRDLAHALRGSALAVGATRVAEAAADYENLGSEDNAVSRTEFQTLARALAEAKAMIRERIG